MYKQTHYEIGDVLRNGAIILKSRTALNGDHYVLATWGKTRQEWITWIVSPEGDTSQGHYFFDEQSGLDDLDKRAGGKAL